MEKHKHFELIVAWAKGNEIQYFDKEEWKDISTPSWDPEIKYRIKPKEPEKKVIPFSFEDAEAIIGRVVQRKKEYEETREIIQTITAVSLTGVYLPYHGCRTFKDLMEEYEFLGGILCGKIK